MGIVKYDINDFIEDSITYLIFGIVAIILLGFLVIPLIFCIYESWWYLLTYIFFAPVCYWFFKSVF